MKLKKYNQFINESVDVLGLSEESIRNYFQYLIDLSDYSLISELGYIRTPMGLPQLVSLPSINSVQKHAKIGCRVYIRLNNENDRNDITDDIRHIVENIELDFGKDTLYFEYNFQQVDYLNSYLLEIIILSKTFKLLDDYIKNSKSIKINESAQINTYPRNIRDYIQPLIDNNKKYNIMYMLNNGKNKDVTTLNFGIPIPDKFENDDKIGYIIDISFLKEKFSEQECIDEIQHIFDNLLIDYPTIQLGYNFQYSHADQYKLFIFICWKDNLARLFHVDEFEYTKNIKFNRSKSLKIG